MTIDKLITALAKEHPFEGRDFIKNELTTVQNAYGIEPEIVGEYLSYKYKCVAQQKKPLAIFFWYVDVYKTVKKE